MFGIGAQEMMVVLVVALLVFGPKRLPELARTVGRGLAEFRRASTDIRQAFNGDEPRRSRPKGPAQSIGAGGDEAREAEVASRKKAAARKAAAADTSDDDTPAAEAAPAQPESEQLELGAVPTQPRQKPAGETPPTRSPGSSDPATRVAATGSADAEATPDRTEAPAPSAPDRKPPTDGRGVG